MSAQLSCPDQGQLLRLLRGELIAAQVTTLQGHLQRCAACREAFQRLPRGDSAQTLAAPTPSQNPAGMQETGIVDAGAGAPTSIAAIIASASASAKGRVQIGPYQVLEVVGKGSVGRVLKAFDPVLQRVVAIKVLSEPLAAVAGARRRFLREAQSAAAIVHPNVITIHAVKELDGNPLLVMEYIPGQSLRQRLQSSQPLETAEIVRLGMQIAAGLAAAHALGVVHRDLKPANILLEGDTGSLKLTDFGLAQVAHDGSTEPSGVLAGDPAYCSPEQARGAASDWRSDLFSLGSLLYHLCANHPPFPAPNAPAVLQRILTDTPRSLRAINPATPRWLAALISKLMEKDPAERYQSANEVVEELGQQLLRMEQTLPVPLPGVRIRRPTRKRRRLGIAIVGLVLLAGLGLTAWLAGWLPFGKAPEPGPGCPPSTAPVVASDTLPLGWKKLFNGKDLTGWKTHPDTPGDWKVGGGILTGKGPTPSYLFSERDDYENFHLLVEARVSVRGDSGLCFRCDFDRRNPFGVPLGYEAQLAGDEAPTMKTGSLCHLVDRPLCSVSTLQWLKYEVIADGNRLQTRIDGKPVVDYADPLYRYSRGHLALQLYTADTVVQFRRIEIKELPPTPEGSGPLLVHRFGPTDHLLSPNEVAVEGDGEGWRADHSGVLKSLPLFQLDNVVLPPGHLRFTGKMLVQNLTTATLVLVCHFKDGRTVTFSHLWPAKNVASWQELSNGAYHLDSTVRLQSLALQLRVAGEGSVKFKDLELTNMPAVTPVQQVIPFPGAVVQATPAGVLAGNCEGISTVLAGHDSRTLLSGGHNWTAWQRDDKGWRRLRSFGPGMCYCGALTSDGRTLVAGKYEKRIDVFQRSGDSWQGRPGLTPVTARVTDLAVRPDGQVLASISGTPGVLTLLDPAGQQEPPPLELGILSNLSCVAFSPDGQTLVLGTHNGQVALCSLESREVMTTLKSPGAVLCLAFSPDGQTLAAGRANGTITLYRHSGDRWQEQATLNHGTAVRKLAFGRQGKVLASAGDSRAAVLWDVASRKKQALLEAHLERVQGLAFTPDGRTLATGGREGWVTLWTIGE
jgi:hypothetical protein